MLLPMALLTILLAGFPEKMVDRSFRKLSRRYKKDISHSSQISSHRPHKPFPDSLPRNPKRPVQFIATSRIRNMTVNRLDVNPHQIGQFSSPVPPLHESATKPLVEPFRFKAFQRPSSMSHALSAGLGILQTPRILSPSISAQSRAR